MNEPVAIISDIHGNYPALKAVLSDIKDNGVKQIFCLGDLVGYYCYVNEVVDTIQALDIPCIMGNHDFALAYNNGVIERSKTCTKILNWQLERISERNFDFIKTLRPSMSLDLNDKSHFLTHGGLSDNIDEYLFNVSDEYFIANNFKKDVLVTGHTHLPNMKKFYSGQTWLNPGSVGQPRDGDNRASYLIINTDHTFSFIRVVYDYNSVVEKMKANHFDHYISNPLITGLKIGYGSYTI